MASSTKTVTRVLAASALALALTLTACGKDSNTKVSASDQAPVSLPGKLTDKGRVDLSGKGAAATQEIEADDNYFKPTFIKAAPGAVLTIELKNEGKNPHTFSVDDGQVDQQLAPGSSKTVKVTVPMTGSLRFHCNFHGNMGMQGAIYTAKAGATATTVATTTTASSGGSGY